MSQFFSAAYGDACLLTGDEMKTFLKNYIRKNKLIEAESEDFDEDELEESILDELYDSIFCRDIALIRGNCIGKADHYAVNRRSLNSPFAFSGIQFINDDNIEGAYFTPLFRKDGSLNICEKQSDGTIAKYPEGDWVEGSKYEFAIFSDKSRTSNETFLENPYPTVESFVDEFQQKLGAYLPDGFDLKSRLGHVMYAEYA